MDVIRLQNVSLWRRTQEEFSYDLKRTLLSILDGRYRKPSRKQVLNNVNLQVAAGERLGIIGANGSGKSTLLKLICGILRPTDGKVLVRGTIAPLIELGAGFDPDLSLIDNIELYGVLLGRSRTEMRRRTGDILAFADLKSCAEAPVKTLSSGMAARLGFAIATDAQPDILILDEVLAVGDERFRERCNERLQQLWAGAATVLVVSHDLAYIARHCSRAVWLQTGQLRSEGDPTTVVEAYLASTQAMRSISLS